MERTQIYLEKLHKEKLQQMAKESGKTMAELIREAVELYITNDQQQALNKLEETRGLWSDRDDIDDAVSYVKSMRENWKTRLED